LEHAFGEVGQNDFSIRRETLSVHTPLDCVAAAQCQQALSVQLRKMAENKIFPTLVAGCETLMKLDAIVQVLRAAVLHCPQIFPV